MGRQEEPGGVQSQNGAAHGQLVLKPRGRRAGDPRSVPAPIKGVSIMPRACSESPKPTAPREPPDNNIRKAGMNVGASISRKPVSLAEHAVDEMGEVIACEVALHLQAVHPLGAT